MCIRDRVGTLYYFVVVSSSCGPPVTSLVTGAHTVTPLTVITTQPVGATYCEDATATALNIGATGTGTVTYEWFTNGTSTTSGAVSVGTGTTFTPPTSSPGTRFYFAVATGTCGSVNSTIIPVVVNPETAITTQPVGATYCEDATPVALSISATGTGTISYQWFGNTTNSTVGGVAVGTNSTFTPPTSTPGTFYYYAVATSPSCGSVTSAIVPVVVNPETLITTQPVGATYCEDTTPVPLSIAATGTGTVTYEWFSNSTNSTVGAVSVGTNATFSPPTSTSGSRFYYAVATGSCGIVTSNIVQVIVNPETLITTQPVGATYCEDAPPTVLSLSLIHI